MQTDKPAKIVAHRGYAEAYPENTLPAIKAAVDAGVMAVEVDIQFSKDGVALLLHDTDFKRVANIDSNVFETSIADIKGISINQKEKFCDKFNGVYSCTLTELVEFVIQTPCLTVFIEIKHESVAQFGVSYVVDQLGSILDSIKQQCTIISYSSDFLEVVRVQLGYDVGHILTLWDESNLLSAQQLKPEFVICNHRKIPENINFRDYPWQWLLYEITDCIQFDYYSRLGVQWMESMNPIKLIDCVNAKSHYHG